MNNRIKKLKNGDFEVVYHENISTSYNIRVYYTYVK